MDSNIIENYRIFGLPANVARNYAFVGDNLINRQSGKIYVGVDLIDNVIDELKNEGVTMRGVHDKVKDRYHNISFDKIKNNFRNDVVIQTRKHSKRRRFNAIKVTDAKSPFEMVQCDITECSDTWNVHNPNRRVLRRGANRNKDYIFTCIDKFSRWSYAELLADKSSGSTLLAIQNMIE